MSGPGAVQRHRRALAGEGGFSLIEVLVAALMLALVIGASSSLFITGNDNSLAAQRTSSLISLADQQIETIRDEVKTKGFDQLAMSAAPASGSSATLSFSSTTQIDPNYFVSAGSGCGSSNEGYEIEANYDHSSEGPASGVVPWSGCTDTTSAIAEPLEILSGGFVTPQQTNVTVGSDTATVDTYVTDAYVGCNSSLGGCPTTSGNLVAGCTWPSATTASTTCADARRVVVAVVPNNHGRYVIGQSSPVYVSTVFTNPTPSNAPDSSIGITLGVQLG